MIFFSSAVYSRRIYARFRSSLALDRFAAAATDEKRAAGLRWAHAWMMVENEMVRCKDSDRVAAARERSVRHFRATAYSVSVESSSQS
jgi:hypothetical protein